MHTALVLSAPHQFLLEAHLSFSILTPIISYGHRVGSGKKEPKRYVSYHLGRRLEHIRGDVREGSRDS